MVPTLLVMPDYGNAPFLWREGSCHCDATYWDESMPMSEGLWRKFADWAIDFDRTSPWFDDKCWRDWDWPAYHARGLQLARWLKDEVGGDYRVVYAKANEDPNHRDQEDREILADGSLLVLSAQERPYPRPAWFAERIVSGGQAGADRAALDFAIEHGYLHGGHCPQGRKAEDGPIPLRYQLIETASDGYRQRTRRNVEDSDATLILNLGEFDGGSEQTRRFAERLQKPVRVVQLDDAAIVREDAAAATLRWLEQHTVAVLNVAGPRESKRPGIYAVARAYLDWLQEVASATAA